MAGGRQRGGPSSPCSYRHSAAQYLFACAARRRGAQSRRSAGVALGWRSVPAGASASGWRVRDRPLRMGPAPHAGRRARTRRCRRTGGVGSTRLRGAGRQRSFEQAVSVRRPLNAHPSYGYPPMSRTAKRKVRIRERRKRAKSRPQKFTARIKDSYSKVSEKYKWLFRGIGAVIIALAIGALTSIFPIASSRIVVSEVLYDKINLSEWILTDSIRTEKMQVVIAFINMGFKEGHIQSCEARPISLRTMGETAETVFVDKSRIGWLEKSEIRCEIVAISNTRSVAEAGGGIVRWDFVFYDDQGRQVAVIEAKSIYDVRASPLMPPRVSR